MNDLENIPADLAVFWAGFVAVLVGSFANRCHSEELALIVLMATYTGARVLHSVFYLTSMTPFRSISYMTGLFSVLSASGVLVSAARSAFDA